MVKVMKKVSKNYVMNAKVARNGNDKVKVFDVTLDGAMGFLDPVGVWGNIEIMGRREKALSLLGMWEGLKVFEKKKEIDIRYFSNIKFQGKIRGCKSYGKLVGVRCGDVIVDIDDGKELLFKEVYKTEVLKRFGNVIQNLRRLEKEKEEDIVLLDYMKGDEKSPISHVEILKELIEN